MLQTRLRQIDAQKLHSRLADAFEEYLCATVERKARAEISLVGTFIVGSYLTPAFAPGESDIDVVVGVNSPPPNSVCEGFWRVVNSDSRVQQSITSAISSDVS